MAVVISLPLSPSSPGLRCFLGTAAFLQAALLWGSNTHSVPWGHTAAPGSLALPQDGQGITFPMALFLCGVTANPGIVLKEN